METAVMVTIIVFGATILFGLGLAAIRHWRRGPGARPRVPFSPADLMSDFEVSQAIGVSVAARAADESPTGWARLDAYHAVQGDIPLMRASVLTGRPARVAMRLRRQVGRPLARVGEEAYAGDDWAIGRHGTVVLLLEQREPTRWTVVGAMPWLLDTALGRVPSNLYR